ncbi:MAG: hypothetical protein CSB55_05530 [Candidatus Cloacimonadota bacterium]|nr:MAG: hypothetical protein CSB55_05530 [Candidatus Cloacimonadota bacterium]
MKKFSIGLVIFLIGSFSYAADLLLNPSATASAGNNLLLLEPTCSGSFINPSVNSQGIEFACSNLYNLNEITAYYSGVSVQKQKINFFFHEYFLDNNLYSESNSLLGFSYKFKFFEAGLNYRLIYCNVRNYDHDYSSLFDAGFHFKYKRYDIHASVKNIMRASVSGEKLPTHIITETAFQLTSFAKISLGLEKQTDFEPIIKSGIAVRPFKELGLIVSYQQNPERLGAGAIISFRKINLTWSILTHTILPLTHHVSLEFKI